MTTLTDAANLAEAPPKVGGGLPVLGHTVDFIRDTVGLLRRAYAEQGPVAQLKVAHMDLVLLSGPEASEVFFRAPDSVLSPKEPYKFMVPVFGKDVVYDAPPAKMREQLGMILPALRDKAMRTYGEIVADEVRRSIADWGDEGVVDIVEYARSLTNFTSSSCLLGHEFRNEMTEEFAEVYHDLERGITPLAYINAHLPIPAFRKRDAARVRLVEMIGEIIEKRRHSNREGVDFLQTLMDAKYKGGAPLSEHEITGMLLAAMFAGHHTSSVTTSWCLLELLRARSYLDRMLGELDQVYEEAGGVTYQSLREIPLTEQAIKETLRLHPPLFLLMRHANEDVDIGRYRIKKGTYVLASPAVSHRIESVFANPDKWDPDRFGPGREEDKEAFTFIAFGGGRHLCMGNAFAYMQVKTIFAMLLRSYEFSLIGDPIEADYSAAVVGPKEPCRVRYRRRREVKA